MTTELKLFSLLPMNTRTYQCREVTIAKEEKTEKVYNLSETARTGFSSVANKITSAAEKMRPRGRSYTEASGQSPPRLALRLELRSPIKPLEDLQTGSPSKRKRVTDRAIKGQHDDIQLGASYKDQSLNIEGSHRRKQPSSTREDETIKEDYSSDQNRNPWRYNDSLSLEPTSTNPDDNCISLYSTTSFIEAPTTDDFNQSPTDQLAGPSSAGPSSAVLSVAATACAGSTNDQTNGIMSLVCHKQYLYAIGVMLEGAATTNVCRYPLDLVERDGSYQNWKKIGSLPKRRPYHAAVSIDELILVTGGGSWNRNIETLTSAIRLAPSKHSQPTWFKHDAIDSFKVPRRKHCCIASGGDIVVLGGENSNNQKLSSGEVASLIPNEELGFNKIECETIQPMNHSRSSFIAVNHNGFIYVIGGCDQEKSSGKITMESYNSILDQWTDLDGFNSGMRSIFGFVYESKICILGGDSKTCDLSEETATSLETKNMDPPPIAWKSPPAINLPDVDLNDSIATAVGIVCSKAHG